MLVAGKLDEGDDESTRMVAVVVQKGVVKITIREDVNPTEALRQPINRLLGSEFPSGAAGDSLLQHAGVNPLNP